MPYPWNSNETLTAGDLNAAIGMASGTGGAGTANAGRNYIHNATMAIAQRGNGPWNAGGNYTADRWALTLVSDAANITRVAMTDGDRAAIGDETAAYALHNGFTGSFAAGAFHYLGQSIEGVRRLSGKTVIVSFWANAASTTKLGINLLQSFGTGGSSIQWATPVTVTLAPTWARYSATFTVPSVAFKTVGSANDATTLALCYSSDPANPNSGTVGVQNGSVNIWGIQLEVGNIATPLEKLDPQQDLANCQRFYQVGNAGIGTYALTGNIIFVNGTLLTTMRASPLFTLSSQNYTNASGATVTAFGGFGSYQAAATVTATGYAQFSTSYAASADF